MTNDTTEQIPAIKVSLTELAQMRTRISRRLAQFAVLAILLPTLGPVLLEWLAPAGMSAGAALWWGIVSVAGALSRLEVSLSQHWEQTAVLAVCYTIYLLVLVVNQTLSCAELTVNTELSPVEKFEKARKGCIVMKKSVIWFGWAYLVVFGLTIVSLVYKIAVMSDVEISTEATTLFLVGPIAALLAIISPMFSFLIPRPLRTLVSSNENSDKVRSALTAMGDVPWEENTVGFYSYPGIYFYWLCKQENMLDKWIHVDGGKDARQQA